MAPTSIVDNTTLRTAQGDWAVDHYQKSEGGMRLEQWVTTSVMGMPAKLTYHDDNGTDLTFEILFMNNDWRTRIPIQPI